MLSFSFVASSFGLLSSSSDDESLEDGSSGVESLLKQKGERTWNQRFGYVSGDTYTMSGIFCSE